MEDTHDNNGPGVDVAQDVLCLRTLIANVCFVGQPDGPWVLVDAGVRGTGPQIRAVAAQRFGAGRAPACMVLTHGHFDHVGALADLCAAWDVPIYAHPLELPYLTGEADYPEPDPTVGGGLIARLSPLFPNEGINLGQRVWPLPGDGSVPGLPGWQWIHTPGHTPGHVSLFRPADRVLISGDAFITVEQESAIAVLLQRQQIDGPPAYFTTDWGAARESVQRLAARKPSAVGPGHGLPMRGAELARALAELAQEFDRLAVPAQGRYVPGEDGVSP